MSLPGSGQLSVPLYMHEPGTEIYKRACARLPLNRRKGPALYLLGTDALRSGNYSLIASEHTTDFLTLGVFRPVGYLIEKLPNSSTAVTVAPKPKQPVSRFQINGRDGRGSNVAETAKTATGSKANPLR